MRPKVHLKTSRQDDAHSESAGSARFSADESGTSATMRMAAADNRASDPTGMKPGRWPPKINAQLEVGAPSALGFEPISIADLRQRWLDHHEHVRRSSLETIGRYRSATAAPDQLPSRCAAASPRIRFPPGSCRGVCSVPSWRSKSRRTATTTPQAAASRQRASSTSSRRARRCSITPIGIGICRHTPRTRFARSRSAGSPSRMPRRYSSSRRSRNDNSLRPATRGSSRSF